MNNPTQILKLEYLSGISRFRRISEKIHIDGDKIYQENGLNFKAKWFSVFHLLTQEEEPKTILTLAQEIGVSHITIKNIVRELEDQNLVTIKTHPTDKRSKQVSITQNGKQLLEKLEQIWTPFIEIIKNLLDVGHPDCINILNRIEVDLSKNPIHEQIHKLANKPKISIVDYKPSLKKSFYELAGRWLIDGLNGSLEEEDNFTLHHPDQAYLLSGGFIFYALQNDQPVGCIALKRLSEDIFEFSKLFINPQARNLGIATRLIQRCIGRCKENGAKQLWMQSTSQMPEAHQLYHKLGFVTQPAPMQMKVLRRTEEIMVIKL